MAAGIRELGSFVGDALMRGLRPRANRGGVGRGHLGAQGETSGSGPAFIWFIAPYRERRP